MLNPAANKTSSAALPDHGVQPDDLTVEPLIALAKTFRHPDATNNKIDYPNFNKAIQLSGRCFVIADVTAVILAYIGGVLATVIFNTFLEHVTPGSLAEVNSGDTQQFFISVGLGCVAILWLDMKGHYRQRLPYWETLKHFSIVASVGLIFGGFLQYTMTDSFSRLQLTMFWALLGIFLFVGRATAVRLLEKQGRWKINTIIIGTKTTSQAIIRALDRERHMGFKIIGQIPSKYMQHLKTSNSWKQLLMLHEADQVLMALEGSEIESHQVSMHSMVRSRVPYSIIPPWLGLPSSTVSPHHFMMHDVMILHNTNRLRQPLLRMVKRAFDFTAALLAVAALSPVFIATALLVRKDGGPAFFSQLRVGRNGKLFECYKFRSMRVDAEQVLDTYLASNPAAAEEWTKFQKLSNDVRITSFGQLIRKTSIDELPQLINVLKGDMSLVGPRPIMQGQEDFYAEDFSYYESVRPGITGPWQVSGRSKLTFKERVALEAWYARNWTLWMDIVIICKTFPSLLKRGHAV